MPPVREDEEEIREFPSLGPVEVQVIQVFVDGVKVLGFPRSIGEIYGLLFISPDPLSLDDLVQRFPPPADYPPLEDAPELLKGRDVKDLPVRRL